MGPFLTAPADPLLRPDTAPTDLAGWETRQLLNPVLGEPRVAAAFGDGSLDGAEGTGLAPSSHLFEAA